MKEILKTYPFFFLFSLSMILCGIGSSLSLVAVLDLMRTDGVGVQGYAWAFALTFFPALVSSEFSQRMSRHIPFHLLFVCMNLLGISVCLLNIWNLSHHHSFIYYLTIVMGSWIGGSSFPLYQVLLRRTIQEHHLGFMSAYENFTFGLNFFMGELLGVLLLPILGPKIYFMTDISAYLFSICVISSLAYFGKLQFEKMRTQGSSAVVSVTWTPQKRFDFSIGLALAMICAPLMAIMLGYMAETSFTQSTLLGMSPVLFGILSRSCGQLLGPLVSLRIGMDRVSKSVYPLGFCVLIFISFYCIAFSTRTLWLAGLCVMLAHISSNIVSSAGFYRFNKSFSADEMGYVSARNYQIVNSIMIVSGIWAGQMGSSFGPYAVASVSFLILASLLFSVRTYGKGGGA